MINYILFAEQLSFETRMWFIAFLITFVAIICFFIYLCAYMEEWEKEQKRRRSK
jgi:sensor histidine kinase regulating citrate/malate metabolism